MIRRKAMFRLLMIAVVCLQVAVDQSYGSVFCDEGRPVVDNNGETIVSCFFNPQFPPEPCPPPTSCNFIPALADKAVACCLPSNITNPCLVNTCDDCTEICVPQCLNNADCSNPVAYCKKIDNIEVDNVCPRPSLIPSPDNCVFDPAINCETFIDCDTTAGEWCCDETCNKVCKTNDDPCLAISCPNGAICVVDTTDSCASPPCPSTAVCIQNPCPNYQLPAVDPAGRIILCDGKCKICPYGYDCVPDSTGRVSVCCRADDNPCDRITCDRDEVCILERVVCVRAPCPPLAVCVPNVCDEGSPARDTLGIIINCDNRDSDCPDDYECVEGSDDSRWDYSLCCKDDGANIGLIVALVVVSIVVFLCLIICCCCCCCQKDQGAPGQGTPGGGYQGGGGCCQGDSCSNFLVCCCGMMCGRCGCCDERPRYPRNDGFATHQPAHYPTPNPVQYPGQQGQISFVNSAPNQGYINPGAAQQNNIAYNNQGLNQVQQNVAFSNQGLNQVQQNVAFSNQGLNQVQQNVAFSNQGLNQVSQANISYTNNAQPLYPGLNNQPVTQPTQYYAGNGPRVFN